MPKKPNDFKMVMSFGDSGDMEPVKISFSTVWEYEVDAVIRALRVSQELMRSEVKPLSRGQSLVAVQHA